MISMIAAVRRAGEIFINMDVRMKWRSYGSNVALLGNESGLGTTLCVASHKAGHDDEVIPSAQAHEFHLMGMLHDSLLD
ncbi:hypothetical protein [Massilia oculi]|uniref:hypothetical protein n=1 Tax=Massilia oculi TaxID=945844 RepID=UPI001AAF4E09|nr:hypothetical protein [Massilia oculi]